MEWWLAFHDHDVCITDSSSIPMRNMSTGIKPKYTRLKKKELISLICVQLVGKRTAVSPRECGL